MKKYHKIFTAVAALVAVSIGSMASPVYYTIFHALEEDTMEVFSDGGSGTLSVSLDEGQSFEILSDFSFDSYGRGYARVYSLNKIPASSPVNIMATFNESDRGQPVDTVIETTAGEFLDSLSPYQQWPWLAYSPIYVSYESLPDIVDTAIEAGIFNTLVDAVIAAGLEETLRSDGPFTVFAPTDDAFEDLLVLLGVTAEQLLADPGLGDILLYHVVDGALDGDAVSAETHIETLLGKDVDVEIVGEDLFINDSKVVIANVEAANGIIHAIDAVLLPPTLPNIVEIAAANEDLETLVAALQATGLDVVLTNEGPFTVFAPTDDAFEALGIPAADLLSDTNLVNILLYHVADGRLKAEDVVAVERITTLLGENVKVNVTDEGVFINDAKVIVTDIKAENGIIHLIDAVLIYEPMPDIVDIAISAGQFNILVELLQATGLDEVLRGDGPFTVFAPTDKAFEKLPKWVLGFLANNPEDLEQLLLYHVVSGDLNASEVLDAGELATLQGENVHVTQNGGNVYIDGSKVIAADVEAENGTIHVIDRVLIPWLKE